MKKLILSIGLSIGCGLIAVAQDWESWKLPAGEPQFKKGEGAQLVVANCLICHSADYVSMQPPLDEARWTAIVQKMRKTYGAPLPEDKVDEVVKYIMANYEK